MFPWLIGGNSRTFRIQHTLILRQTPASQGPSIQSGLFRNWPIEFARTTNAYIYMATGMGPVTKWDGLSLQVAEAGVVAPTTAITISFTGTGGAITGTYQAYVRFLDADGNVSNLSPVSTEVTADEATTVTYTNVPVPTEGNIVRRQILRNTAGQFLTFYVDIDTTNLFDSTFTSVRTDEELRLQFPVPLFDDQLNLNIANFHDPPPDDKPYISFYQNRLWLWGHPEYSEGNAQVATGSTTVTIIGAPITDAFVDRLLYVDGADRFYLISSVDVEAGTMTLETAYMGETDMWAKYTVRPDANRRHLLCYSEPGQFDSWRANQNIAVASSDDIEDEGTGLVSTQSFLFILQRRHIYRMTFFEDPTLDGGVFLSARRGCVNNRCWISVDGWVYLLDDRGIYRFSGGDDVEETSLPIQDIFYFDRPEGERRINWAASTFFHASHDRNDSTLRWFVSFSGTRYPRHALCFNYTVPQWWIEEYPWPMGDSSLLKHVNPITVSASEAHRVFAIGVGTLDNLKVGSGDTLLDVASAGVRSVTAATGYRLPASLAGVPVAIVSGRGKGQMRNITDASGNTLFVDRPWGEKPDDTSVVRLGAIPYKWRSHWMRWRQTEHETKRRFAASFLPTREATLDFRVYQDYATEPREWDLTWPINENAGSGMSTILGSPDAVIDLTIPHGYSYLELDSMRELQVWRKDVVSLEIRGYSADGPVRIYEIDAEGAE